MNALIYYKDHMHHSEIETVLHFMFVNTYLHRYIINAPLTATRVQSSVPCYYLIKRIECTVTRSTGG